MSTSRRQHRLNPIGMAFLVSAFFVTVLGCGPGAPVEVPQSFKNWNSPDGTFALEYPEGWEADGKGNRSRGIAWALFTKRALRVRLDASFADSLGVGAQGMNGDFEVMPLEEALQKKYRSHFEERFRDFDEDEGEAKRFNLGPGFINKFSGKDGSIKTKGIRATIVARDRSVFFEAHCPESQWEDFEPVFERMLDGIKPGVEEFGR